MKRIINFKGADMTIDLHSSCLERLRESIIKSLYAIRIDYDNFIDRESAMNLFECDRALPNPGKIKNPKGDLLNYIGEYPIFDFVYETISKELIENQLFNANSKDINLTSYENYKDVDKTADRLIQDLLTLPWTYKFSLSISKDLIGPADIIEDTVVFGMGISLSRITEEFERKFHLISPNQARNNNISRNRGLISWNNNPSWSKDALCLQVERTGFVGQHSKTSPVVSAEEAVKSFFGLGLALQIFKYGNSYFPAPPQHHLYVHRMEADRWSIDSRNDLDSEFSEAIAQMTYENLGGRIKEDQKVGWLLYHFKQMKTCFLLGAERGEPILLACRWLFDSYTGKNELLSYVQATVALEILLGDKASSDLMGLGELLRNRCAYLIGSTNTERHSILEDFKNIYEIRCKIVHRGKSRLSYAERAMFNKLRRMCARVIQKEVDLLCKESESS